MKFIEKFDEGYELWNVSYPELIEDIGRLRIEAWKTEKGINEEVFAKEIWCDEFDKRAFHWVIKFENILAAAARMSFHFAYHNMPWAYSMADYDLSDLKFPLASINRLVVHPAHRRKGLTKKLDLIRINLARELGATAIIAQPVPARIKALSNYGFKYLGKLGRTFELPGVNFSLMVMYLTDEKK